MALSPELSSLRTTVSTHPDAVGSTAVLLKGVADRIDAVKGDQAKLTALAVELRNDATNFGQAVVANTPHVAGRPTDRTPNS